MEAKSIERIAEELGVNFYDLHPLISARDEFIKKVGIREVVEFIKSHGDVTRCDPDTMAYFCDYLWIDLVEWQAQLKEWFKDSPELLKQWRVK